MDGVINIYDTNIADEDDALIHIINHGSSISHAGFLSDTEIYALSHDESFTVQQLADSGEKSSLLSSSPSPVDQSRQVFGDLRPILECDYIVDVIQSSRPNEVIIGAGSSRYLMRLCYNLFQSLNRELVRLAGAKEKKNFIPSRRHNISI